MNVPRQEFRPLHDFYPETNFEKLDDQLFLARMDKCVKRLKEVENCVVGLIYETVKREIHLDFDCKTGREFFNRKGVSTALYEVGMAIGRHVEDLPVVKHYFMNGQIEYTKLKLVCRFIKEDEQELWLERLWTMSRRELEELLKCLGLKNRTERKALLELSSLRFMTFRCKEFRRAFDLANAEDSSITTHTKFLGTLLDCWRKAGGRERKEAVSKEPSYEIILYKNEDTGIIRDEPNEDGKEISAEEVLALGEPKRTETLEKLHYKALQACMSQLERALNRVNGDWSRVEIPRSIPKAVKDFVVAATGGKCAVPGCNNEPTDFHHLFRWLLQKFHFPGRLRFLCHLHHGLAGSGKISQEELGLPAPANVKEAARVDELTRRMRDRAITEKIEKRKAANS